MCPTCESPKRVLWTFHNLPHLVIERLENWMALERCQACGALWCAVPHEPHGYMLLTAWPYDTAVFDRLIAQHHGHILHEWHDAVIRETWQNLSAKEVEWIEEWRNRSHRNDNPIDQGPDMRPPQFVHESSEISRYLKVTESRKWKKSTLAALSLLALMLFLVAAYQISSKW